ncbi:MAG: hypothetical protein U1G07_07640 [Verrucomicrobiota bacterium]
MRKLLIAGLVLLAAVALLLIALLSLAAKGGRPLATVALADGRVFHVEGVSYGTNHVIGVRSVVVDRLGPWLPAAVRQALAPKRPQSDIHLDRPALVVWVNATDPVSGKQVDCQGVRLELLDAHGDLFGQETSSWFGGADFWRVGHIFYAFPRSERQLTLRIVPWRQQVPAQVTILNPHRASVEPLADKPLPQQMRVGELELSLLHLSARTNGGPENYWQTPTVYYEPTWSLTKNGAPAPGWSKPEWIAEDGSGNRSQFLGVHQPALRFTVNYYPLATNDNACRHVTSSPPFSLQDLSSNVWWNPNAGPATQTPVLLGVFVPGTHVFSEGIYQTNPPSRMGPVRGGAPSGWVGQSQRVTPLKLRHWHGHYTPSPVIYLRAFARPSDERWGLRLRDATGQLWIAQPEPQGMVDGILPFLLDTPPDLDTVTAELVILRPIRGHFDVTTKRASQP